MSKSLQYVKVFEALQAAGGPMTVAQIKAIPDIVPTRLSTYLWEIKKFTGCAVKSNRDGRTVVSYELVGAGSVPAPKVAAPKAAKTPKAVTPKAPKAPKATKPAKTKTVAPTVEADPLTMNMVEKDDKIVDILDEMDTAVSSFEDREFAEDYVKSL